jgi:hypothetical protein
MRPFFVYQRLAYIVVCRGSPCSSPYAIAEKREETGLEKIFFGLSEKNDQNSPSQTG